MSQMTPTDDADADRSTDDLEFEHAVADAIDANARLMDALEALQGEEFTEPHERGFADGLIDKLTETNRRTTLLEKRVSDDVDLSSHTDRWDEFATHYSQ